MISQETNTYQAQCHANYRGGWVAIWSTCTRCYGRLYSNNRQIFTCIHKHKTHTWAFTINRDIINHTHTDKQTTGRETEILQMHTLSLSAHVIVLCKSVKQTFVEGQRLTNTIFTQTKQVPILCYLNFKMLVDFLAIGSSCSTQWQ